MFLNLNFTDPVTGTLHGSRLTYWQFPQVIVGNHRASTPNSFTSIVIRDAFGCGYHCTDFGVIVGSGVLLTRILGSCDTTSPSKAATTIIFTIRSLTPVY